MNSLFKIYIHPRNLVYIYCSGGEKFFLKLYESPQNSKRLKGVTKQVPHWEPTNIRRYNTKFSRRGYLAPGIYTRCIIATYIFMILHLRCDLASGTFPSISPPKMSCIYLVYPVPGQPMLTRHIDLELTILPCISLE